MNVKPQLVNKGLEKGENAGGLITEWWEGY
jgi:hypothetical protein